MIKRIIQEIEKRCGVIFDEDKIKIELEMRNITPEELLFNDEKLENFMEDILIKETYFFREKGHLEVLRNYIYFDILEKRSRVKIWSAGCSTGEEPYSISIILGSRCDGKCRILASDLSRLALEKAKEAVYTKSSLRALEEREIRLYFEELGGKRYRLRDRYRRVEFFRHNLLDPVPTSKGRFDVIFVRNVLMYFSERAKKIAVKNIKDALYDDGYIILGVSEYLIGVENGLYPEEINGVTVFRKYRVKRPVETPVAEIREPKEDVRAKILAVDEQSDVKELILNALKLLEEGSIRNAIYNLEKAAEINDKIYFIHYMLAQLYEEIGDNTKFFKECVRINDMLEQRIPMSPIDKEFNLRYSVLKNFVNESMEGMKWVLS